MTGNASLPARPSVLRLGFAMLAPPVAWAIHLCVCYFIVTMACQAGWQGAGWSIAAVTLVFGGVASFAGFIAWRGRRTIDSSDASSTARFIYRLGLVASPVFVAAILLAGVAPAFVARCT